MHECRVRSVKVSFAPPPLAWDTVGRRGCGIKPLWGKCQPPRDRLGPVPSCGYSVLQSWVLKGGFEDSGETAGWLPDRCLTGISVPPPGCGKDALGLKNGVCLRVFQGPRGVCFPGVVASASNEKEGGLAHHWSLQVPCGTLGLGRGEGGLVPNNVTLRLCLPPPPHLPSSPLLVPLGKERGRSPGVV